MQKKCVRSISKSDYLAHAQPIFKDLKLLEIDDIVAPTMVRYGSFGEDGMKLGMIVGNDPPNDFLTVTKFFMHRK